EVAETVTDQASGTAYALVVLNRDKYCENLRSELDAGWKQAGGLRSGSTDFANRGKLNEALQNLVDARSVITPLLTRQTLYNVVSNTPYRAPADFGPVTISSDIRNMLSSVKLARKSGDKQKGRVGEPFAEPFVVQVTIDRAGAPVPVAGSTVVFETSDKTKVGEAITDERGMAGFSMTVRTVKGNGVRARLSFKKLDREFEQEFVSSAVNFSWKAEPSGVTFELRMDTQMPKVDVKLRSTLTSLIGEIGYRIVPASNYVIRVSEDEVKVNTVDGMTGTMYSVSVNILATLTEKGADHPLGSVTFAGKALARTQTEANEKAVANAKIGQKELAELLEKAAQK
ncbi:MAG TPA: hypothetical protein VMM37_01205, partial [Bacteroidota bacterium]|nr:hypothetical protein [Bacteroidota bacterium]